MTIDIPVFNEDGSIQWTHKCNPAEAQSLLQFALNFLVANGMTPFTTDEEEDTLENYEFSQEPND